jgi:hypothetical protein
VAWNAQLNSQGWRSRVAVNFLANLANEAGEAAGTAGDLESGALDGTLGGAAPRREDQPPRSG